MFRKIHPLPSLWVALQVDKLGNLKKFMIKPISERGSTYQAKRCREILQQIFNYARALEFCETNPAEAIKYSPEVKSHRSQHRNFLEFHEMGDSLRVLKSSQSTGIIQSKLALELLILTAVRSANARKAR